MVLPHAARRAAGAAGVDDAGEVVAPTRCDACLRAPPTSASPDASSAQRWTLTQSRHLAGADVLDADDVMAFARGEHRRDQVLRQLLVGDDHRARARIAEDVRVIARGVGGVGRHGDAARRHDREVGDQPFGPVLADQRDAVAGLKPDPLAATPRAPRPAAPLRPS